MSDETEYPAGEDNTVSAEGTSDTAAEASEADGEQDGATGE